MAQIPSIDRLLSLAADAPDAVLQSLQTHPHLASKQDDHGYSLVHAAASYGHVELLRALIRDLEVDPNLKDEDGETALFNVEEVNMAKELIDLGTDIDVPNNDGQTAAQKLDDDDEQPAVAAYLRQLKSSSESTLTKTANGLGQSSDNDSLNGTTNETHPPPPPPLPAGMQLNVGTMTAAEAGDEPDPEFRRRIEDLAARQDFETEEAQRELRNLVTDALSGLSNENQAPAATRRRLG